jgi:hypothetical protein
VTAYDEVVRTFDHSPLAGLPAYATATSGRAGMLSVSVMSSILDQAPA